MDRLISKEVGLAAGWAAKNQDISPEQIAEHLDITISNAEHFLHGGGYLGSDKSDKLAVFLGFEPPNPISAMVQKWREAEQQKGEAEQQRIGPLKKYSQSEIRHAFKNVIAARGLSANEISTIAKRNFQTLEEALEHIGYLNARYFPAMLERLGLSIDGLMQENNDIIKDQSAARNLWPTSDEVKQVLRGEIDAAPPGMKMRKYIEIANQIGLEASSLHALLSTPGKSISLKHFPILAQRRGFDSPEKWAASIRSAPFPVQERS